MPKDFPNIDQELLGDYLDGRLDPDTQRFVEGAIEADPRLTAQVAALRAQEARLREIGADVFREPVPDRLREVLVRRFEAASRALEPGPARAAAAGPPPQRRLARWHGPWLGRVAQIAATLVIGIAIGWYASLVLRTEDDLLEPFLRQALLAHQLFESNQDLASLSGAPPQTIGELEAPLATPVRVPELLGSAFRPVMVSSLQAAGGNAMHIAYLQDPEHLTSLFVRQYSNAGVPVKYVERDGRAVLYWLDGPLLYALVGDGSEEELRAMAHSIYVSAAEASPLAAPPGQPQPASQPPVD